MFPYYHGQDIEQWYAFPGSLLSSSGQYHGLIFKTTWLLTIASLWNSLFVKVTDGVTFMVSGFEGIFLYNDQSILKKILWLSCNGNMFWCNSFIYFTEINLSKVFVFFSLSMVSTLPWINCYFVDWLIPDMAKGEVSPKWNRDPTIG